MDSDSGVKPVKEESESECISSCIDEFNNYNDSNTILRILEQTFEGKGIGRVLSAEPRISVSVSGATKTFTPDALIELNDGHILCVEIKAGEGGDFDGIIDEIKRAAEYCNATSWQSGSRVRKIKSSNTIFICTQGYWKKIKWLNDNGSSDVQSILCKDGFTILLWMREDDMIQIRKQHGLCTNSEVDLFLKNHILVETQTILLVQHARFIFTPVKPPVQYTAFMLLMTILPAWWAKAVPLGSSQDNLSRTAGVDEIYEHAKKYFVPSREGDSDQIRKSWIKLGLDTLVKCKYATLKEQEYTIKLKIRANQKQLVTSICKQMCKKLTSKKSKTRKKRKLIKADELQSLLPSFINNGKDNSTD